MKHQFYELTASADYLSFTFQSLSEKRIVLKKIEFSQIDEGLYNLAFGDLREGEDLDDMIVTNNSDTEQVLASVIQAILLFLTVYPKSSIYFEGSTPARTRLYSIILTREQLNWRDMFYVRGVFKDIVVPFEMNIEFTAFLIKLKNI